MCKLRSIDVLCNDGNCSLDLNYHIIKTPGNCPIIGTGADDSRVRVTNRVKS